MRKGTMVVEAIPKSSNVRMVRYRNSDHGAEWVPAVTVGARRFEEKEAYSVDDVLKLTSSGIEVHVRPAQPKTEVVVEKGVWRDVAITPIAKEPPAPAAPPVA